MNKIEGKAYQLLDMTTNNCQWSSERVVPNTQFTANTIQAFPSLCEFCNGPHQSFECQTKNPFAQMTMELSQFVGKVSQQQFNPFLNNNKVSFIFFLPIFFLTISFFFF